MSHGSGIKRSCNYSMFTHLRFARLCNCSGVSDGVRKLCTSVYCLYMYMLYILSSEARFLYYTLAQPISYGFWAYIPCDSKKSFLLSTATQIILPGARACNRNSLHVPQSKHAKATSLLFGQT